MKDIGAEMPVRPDMIWDLLIRLSGVALFVLLVVAYSTGEEFPHTHVMIGYAIATLLVVGIFLGDHQAAPRSVSTGRLQSARNQGAISECGHGTKNAGNRVLDSGGAALVRPDPDVAHAYAVGHNLDRRDARGRRLFRGGTGCFLYCDGGYREQRTCRGPGAEDA
jgi:hypothetical protein